MLFVHLQATAASELANILRISIALSVVAVAARTRNWEASVTTWGWGIGTPRRSTSLHWGVTTSMCTGSVPTLHSNAMKLFEVTFCETSYWSGPITTPKYLATWNVQQLKQNIHLASANTHLQATGTSPMPKAFRIAVALSFAAVVARAPNCKASVVPSRCGRGTPRRSIFLHIGITTSMCKGSVPTRHSKATISWDATDFESS